ncbi:MAG: TIGR00269 family protein [Aquificae bacterium]|nr:TIGR00269 family protein [Aquificota bacterium]
MKCRICGKKPIIYMPHHRLALCKEDFISWFERYTERTIKEFKMFSKEDKILVTVSGGKDSLALWFVLRKLGYEADGFYLHLGIGEYSERSKEKVEKFAQRLKAKLIVEDLKKEMGGIPLLKDITSREACSVCGLVKRYNFNKVARDYGYTVVATGHNLDDEASSLLSNVINWNIKYLGRKYPVLKEEEGFVRKVKPFCKFTEKETALYALLNGIDFIEEECPFSEDASSIFYKEILNRIEEKFPGTKLRFYLEYLRKVYPRFKEEGERDLQPCKVCGQPSPSEICPVCRLREKAVNYLHGHEA